jgi:hypothetical protein
MSGARDYVISGSARKEVADARQAVRAGEPSSPWHGPAHPH